MYPARHNARILSLLVYYREIMCILYLLQFLTNVFLDQVIVTTIIIDELLYMVVMLHQDKLQLDMMTYKGLVCNSSIPCNSFDR